MIPELGAVVLSAGTAGVVGAAGVLATVAVARRSVAAATLVSPVVVVASIAAGVLVSARAMFLSEDVSIVALMLAASVPVALACGLLGYRAVGRMDRAARLALAGRERDQALARSRRQMISWASHDLKSPLAGIRVMAEALEDGLVEDPAEYHRRIRRESDRMTRMVDDLLEMSALQQGRSDLVREQVDLGGLTRDVVQGQIPVAERAGVQVHVEADQPVALRADARRLERAVANVVRNAILYTGQRGRVEVRVGVDEDAPGGRRTAYLQVSDTCGGLGEDELERVFEPGWRGSAHRTPDAEAGAGVGMTIARAIVEEHDGVIELVNDGAGCQVRVRLPADPVERERGGA